MKCKYVGQLCTVLLTAVILFTSLPIHARSLGDGGCLRVDLNPAKTPLWMVSGEWISDRSMVWVDAWRKEILKVDAATGNIVKLELPWQDELERRWSQRLKERSRREGVGRPPIQGPVRIRKGQDHLLLEFAVPSSTISFPPSAYKSGQSDVLNSSFSALEQSEINLLDSRVSPESSRPEWQAKAVSPTPPQIHSTYQIQEVGDGHLAFTSIRVPDHRAKPDYVESFVFISGDTFVDLTPNLERFQIDQFKWADAREYQLVYMPYLAEVGGIGFGLLWGEQPRLIRYDPGGALTVLPLPEGVKGLDLKYETSLTSLQNDLQDYLRIERSDAALGLYAIGEHLFVLYKDVTPTGLTEWWMIEIDSLTGDERGRLRLPTQERTRHLTLVTGVDHVAIVEKGGVQQFGQFPFLESLSLTTFPTGWLTQPYMGENPLVEQAPVICHGP